MLLLVVVKSKRERQSRSSCKLYILSPYKGVFTCPTIFAQGENRMLGTSSKSEAQQQQRSNARAHTHTKQTKSLFWVSRVFLCRCLRSPPFQMKPFSFIATRSSSQANISHNDTP